jgi:hypothetical protein
MNRRHFFTASTLALLHMTQREADAVQALREESQKGDPDAPYEILRYDPESIAALARREDGRAVFQPWDKDLPAKLITTAEQFLGSSRDTTPEQITEFLALFGVPFKTEKGPVPYCAAGLSYCALSAFKLPSKANEPIPTKPQLMFQLKQIMPDLSHYYFYPTVSCLDMYHIAAGLRRWIGHKSEPKTIPRAGWVVLFDWSGRGNPDHCGIVTGATQKVVSTIEFNTSGQAGESERDGGTVSRKERSYKHILGFIKTDQKPPAA